VLPASGAAALTSAGGERPSPPVTTRPTTGPAAAPAGTLAPPEAKRVRALVVTLGDPDPDMALWAIDALRDVGRDAVPYVIEGLRSPSASVRAGAARALGVLADPRALAHLARALADGAKSVRVQAALAIGSLGRIDGLPHLVRALADRHRPVRANAALGIGQAIRLTRSGRKLTAAESAVVAAAVPALIDTLGDTAPLVRGNAAISLGVTRDARALQPLSLAAHDKEPLVRASACHGLGDLGEKAAAGPLIPMLDDPDATVRRSAIEGLESITGLTLDYRAHASPAKRRAAVARWQAWWTRTRATLAPGS